MNLCQWFFFLHFQLTGQKEDLIEYLASNYIDPVSQWYELPDVKRSTYKERYALVEIQEDKERTSSCKYCDIYWCNYDGDVERYNDDTIGLMMMMMILI